MYICWNPDYSVEVAEIDEQHKRFVLLINDLNDAVEIGSEEIVLGDIIGQLSSYADYHFATEEKYFDRFNYKDSAAHKREHELFREKVEVFQKDYPGNEAVVAKSIMSFMSDWIDRHIRQVDKAYVDCFKDNGLK